MNAADFELNLLLPAESRFAPAMRDLAAHAARYAGCNEQEAERYGTTVEHVVHACLEQIGRGAVSGTEQGALQRAVPVVLRRGAGPVEFLIGCERRFEATPPGGRVTIAWTEEQGRAMCRVALEP